MNTLEDLLLMGYDPSGANSLAPAKPYVPMKTFRVNGKEYFIPGSETLSPMQPAPGADPQYQAPPASETWRKAGSLGLDFVPIVGDIKSGQEAITGKDLLTGEKYNWLERTLAGVGTLPFIPNVAGLMAGKGALKAPLGKVGDEWVKVYRGVTGREGDKLLVTLDPVIAKSHSNIVMEGYVKRSELMSGPEELAFYGGKVPSDKVGSIEALINKNQLKVKQPKSGLSLAEDLAAKGADADEIWNKTGWRSDPKGNWAFEIDDSSMKFKNMPKNPYEDVTRKLEDLIDHPSLFENYPKARNIKVELSNGIDSVGSFDKNTIKVRGFDREKQKETLIHEIQHYIQDKERWPKGGNLRTVSTAAYGDRLDNIRIDLDKGMIELGIPGETFYERMREFHGINLNDPFILGGFDKKQQRLIQKLQQLDYESNALHADLVSGRAAHREYKKLFGEFQARDAASRATWNAEARKMVRPYSSEMEPKEGWIFRK